MSRRYSLLTILATLFLALFMVGCGADSSDEGAETANDSDTVEPTEEAEEAEEVEEVMEEEFDRGRGFSSDRYGLGNS